MVNIYIILYVYIIIYMYIMISIYDVVGGIKCYKPNYTWGWHHMKKSGSNRWKLFPFWQQQLRRNDRELLANRVRHHLTCGWHIWNGSSLRTQLWPERPPPLAPPAGIHWFINTSN